MKNPTIKIGFWIALYLLLSLLSQVWAQAAELDLQTLLKLSLKNNADIRVQLEEKQISGWQKWKAYSTMLPQVDAEAGYFKTSGEKGVPGFIGANALQERLAWLSVQQTIFDAGTFLNISQSRLNQKIQAVFYLQTKQDILLQVIESYFAVLQAKGEIEVLKKNLEAFNLLYDQSQVLYQSGVAPELDVKKSRIEYLLQKNSLAEAHKNYASTLIQLKELLGMAIADSLSIADFQPQKVYLDTLSHYLNIARQARPELEIAQLESRQIISEKRAAFLQQLPSVRAGAYYGWDTASSFQGDNLGWQVFINLQMPLWHWGNLHLDRQIASIRYLQNQTLRRQLQVKIDREVIDSYNDCQIQQQQIEAMAESKTEAAEAVRMARLGYQEGIVTNLDIINTQKLLTETNIQYLKAIYNFYVAKARLYRNIGKLEEDLTWLD